MRIVEQDEKPSVTFEDLLLSLQTTKEKKEKVASLPERRMSFFSGSPIVITILGIITVVLGMMVIILKSDIAILKHDMADLKDLKVQVAHFDPAIQVANFESKLADMKKEKEAIKGDMVQLQTDLETVKADEKNATNKRATNKTVKHRPPPSAKNTVREIKNVESLLRRTSPRDMYFSDVSRAMSLDSPTK